MTVVGALVASLCVALLAPNADAQVQPATGAAAGFADQQGQPAQSPPAPTKPGGQSPQDTDVPVVSLVRIRALLAGGSAFTIGDLTPEDRRPVFRSRVDEKAFKLPDLKARLNTGFEAVPPGGLTQYEINRLITPDMYRGMAVFTNKEVLRVMALALRNALLLRGLGWAVDKGMDAWDQRQVEQIREEIRKEIAAIDEENRRKAAEIKPPDEQKPPDPQKQPDPKK